MLDFFFLKGAFSHFLHDLRYGAKHHLSVNYFIFFPLGNFVL